MHGKFFVMKNVVKTRNNEENLVLFVIHLNLNDVVLLDFREVKC